MTLALLADAATAGSVPTDLAAAPDLVAALVAQVVGDVPDDDHMLALAACAHTWLTTEDLLRRFVGERAAEIWRCSTRPFVNRGPDGCIPMTSSVTCWRPKPGAGRPTAIAGSTG